MSEMEQALRRSAALLRKAERLAGVGSWEWDIETDRFTLSEGGQLIYGCTTSTLSRAELAALIHPDDLARVDCAFDVVVAGRPYDIEHRIVRQDDARVCSVHFYGETEFDDEGRPTKVAGVLQDVTERKATEKALWDSEEKLREAEKIAHLGRWELDLTTQTLQWSDTIFGIFELDPTTFGASYGAFLDAIHPHDREMVNQAYSQSLVDKKPYSIEHRLQMKDGRIKWLNEVCRTDYDAQGQPVRSVGIVQDVTERRGAEEALRVSEAHFRHLIQHLSAGVVVHAPDTAILLANQEASRVLGLSLEQMQGKVSVDPAWTFVREDGSRLPHEEYPVSWVLARQQPVTDMTVGVDRLPTGNRVWVLVNAYPNYDVHQRLVQIVVTFVDITKRKEAEIALRESEERHRRLAQENANLVHEVNHRVGNNLALLIALLDWAIEECTVLNTRQTLQDMHGRVESMAEVHRLLNRTRWAPIDLRELIWPVVRGILATAPSHQHIRCEVDAPPAPVWVAAKPAFKIALILNELMTNALKHAFADRDDGKLSIQVTVDGPWLELACSDDGPGWPPDVLSGERQSLGLSLIRAIVELEMEGSVMLYNNRGAATRLRFIPKPEGEFSFG